MKSFKCLWYIVKLLLIASGSVAFMAECVNRIVAVRNVGDLSPVQYRAQSLSFF